jgi:hypothetical protein
VESHGAKPETIVFAEGSLTIFSAKQNGKQNGKNLNLPSEV